MEGEGRNFSFFTEDSSSMSDDDVFTEDSSIQTSALNNGRFQYPLCLSSIILRLQDILLNPRIIDSIKLDFKAEIILLI